MNRVYHTLITLKVVTMFRDIEFIRLSSLSLNHSVYVRNLWTYVYVIYLIYHVTETLKADVKAEIKKNKKFTAIRYFRSGK